MIINDIKNGNAVSAVIGVILMVAITVAIAATVYVYVSGMIGGTQTQTPAIAFIVDTRTDKMTVSSADMGINWYDCEIVTDITNATLSWNGATAHATGTTWVAVNTANFEELYQEDKDAISKVLKAPVRSVIINVWTIAVSFAISVISTIVFFFKQSGQ